MSICRGIAGRRGKNPIGILSTMGQTAKMQRQNITKLLTESKLRKWVCALLCL